MANTNCHFGDDSNGGLERRTLIANVVLLSASLDVRDMKPPIG